MAVVAYIGLWKTDFSDRAAEKAVNAAGIYGFAQAKIR